MYERQTLWKKRVEERVGAYNVVTCLKRRAYNAPAVVPLTADGRRARVHAMQIAAKKAAAQASEEQPSQEYVVVAVVVVDSPVQHGVHRG